MSSLGRSWLSAALLLSLAAGALAAPEAQPAPHDHAKVLKHVLPDRSDLVWSQVPWRATLWDAVVDAHKEKKPIILWAMNGHALACT